jgi:hypothetical protein
VTKLLLVGETKIAEFGVVVGEVRFGMTAATWHGVKPGPDSHVRRRYLIGRYDGTWGINALASAQVPTLTTQLKLHRKSAQQM